MKFVAFSLAILLAASPALAKPLPYNDPADVAAVTAIEKANAVGMDVPTLLAAFAPNAIVYDMMTPGIYKGHDAIAADFKLALQGIKSVSASFPAINVLTDGRMACAATQMLDDVTLQNGTKSQISLRQLDVFRKIDGKWLIEQEHISLPTDPKTQMGIWNAPVTAATPVTFADNPFQGPAVGSVPAKWQIKNWVVKFADAPDAPAVAKLMGPGDSFQIFDMFFPYPVQGRQQLLAAYGPGFSQLLHASVTFRDFTAITDGYMGAQIDTQHLTMKMKGGTTMIWNLRQSDCLHYVNGHWYSVFDELSFPIDMKTGKAVMN